MSIKLDVNSFINFYDFDPSAHNQCIFLTQRLKRCQWSCRDNTQAIALHRHITESRCENIDHFINYVSYNCCKEGNAQHQDRVKNSYLLVPLAKRWKDEVLAKRRSATIETRIAVVAPTASAAPLCPNSPVSDTEANITSATSTPSRYTATETPLTRTSYSRSQSDSSHINDRILSKPDLSPTPAPGIPSSILDTTRCRPPYSDCQAEKNCSRDENSSAVPSSTVLERSLQGPLSEFQPHIKEPSPNDTVSFKLNESLSDRDLKTGWVYIFSRNSSPGHVKIGWTAYSVESRLQNWATCGYTPIKLFSEGDIPHAQRVETLTHYELIKEWRRERRCKAKHCGKSHQEWFEVSQDRAKEVLGMWAKLFKNHSPYTPEGTLTLKWREAVDMLEARSGPVTSRKLLEHFETPVAKTAAFVQDLVDKNQIMCEKEHKVPREPKERERRSRKDRLHSRTTIRDDLEPMIKPEAQLGNEALPVVKELVEVSGSIVKEESEINLSKFPLKVERAAEDGFQVPFEAEPKGEQVAMASKDYIKSTRFRKPRILVRTL